MLPLGPLKHEHGHMPTSPWHWLLLNSRQTGAIGPPFALLQAQIRAAVWVNAALSGAAVQPSLFNTCGDFDRPHMSVSGFSGEMITDYQLVGARVWCRLHHVCHDVRDAWWVGWWQGSGLTTASLAPHKMVLRDGTNKPSQFRVGWFRRYGQSERRVRREAGAIDMTAIVMALFSVTCRWEQRKGGQCCEVPLPEHTIEGRKHLVISTSTYAHGELGRTQCTCGAETSRRSRASGQTLVARACSFDGHQPHAGVSARRKQF